MNNRGHIIQLPTSKQNDIPGLKFLIKIFQTGGKTQTIVFGTLAIVEIDQYVLEIV